jgi:two-component system CheB/CheR fusion protein
MRESSSQAARRLPHRSRTSRLSADSPDRSGDPLVVGIGASAGGLDACRKLLDALPADNDMAFILVQHIDPTHESMMVALLAGHTSLSVEEAAHGVTLQRQHLYVIPPGAYLSISNNSLLLSKPSAGQGVRLPLDFLLSSMAVEFGARAVCVILSGTGADGSVGLKAIAKKGGLVIAQEPEEAAYDGMPRSAISTGAVNMVLSLSEIPGALAQYAHQARIAYDQDRSARRSCAPGAVHEVIQLLRARTDHDFTFYKRATLERRIRRRMAMAGIEVDSEDRYLDLLHNDLGEIELLAKDLLINVTGFFRDQKVFHLLATSTIPDLVRAQKPDQPLRIWIVGCSTGEEAYSLAMLFQEEIGIDGRNVKVQLFGSDVDPDSVAYAREGLYPGSIEAEVSSERLTRFFSKEEGSYRVLPELRATVVFAVQDILDDPPFARVDMISCRNLLIYLLPEAQQKVISVFHFALRQGGILLLGSAETPGEVDGRFATVSDAERLYRQVGRRPARFGHQAPTGTGMKVHTHVGNNLAPQSGTGLAELCRRVVIDEYAPAAILINRNYECLYSLGPTHKYLHVAAGHPTHDLLAMAPNALRAKIRSAVRQASETRACFEISRQKMYYDGRELSFKVAVQPVQSQTDELLLICFIDEPKAQEKRSRRTSTGDVSEVVHLTHLLEATRADLRDAVRGLEIAGEEHRTIDEEARSVNEEYQSLNEELMTSKEELQSLNEELTALNGQLQETLDQQRTTSNDLENVLVSTDVATLFLDLDLRIRFFTPAIKSLFSVIASDVGRPLRDLRSLANDGELLNDARITLQIQSPIEREVETDAGEWYFRRILPYRTREGRVEGVVVTFTNVTERKNAAIAVEAAKQLAERASVAKSRFLAAASHDLRQPLQTFALIQGLLAKTVERESERRLVAKLDQTTHTMSGILNALLDINQIEAGSVRAEMTTFPVNELLDRLRDDLVYHTPAKGLTMRVVSCSLFVKSDPRLLEQMTRNLLANALKYTERGKVLLGCRRRGTTLSLEIWDTGLGIPDNQLEAIFEEYHQIDNAARDPTRGLGLGLSIVRRLGDLLGHNVSVRSQHGKGSTFAIDVELSIGVSAQLTEIHPSGGEKEIIERDRRAKSIIVIEDDPRERELLGMLLDHEGYRSVTVADGPTAIALAKQEQLRPDLILADYNLPNGMTGLEAASKLREWLQSTVPVIILTGDISTGALRDIVAHGCVRLNKPVRSVAILEAIRRLLRMPSHPRELDSPRPVQPINRRTPHVFVVDDDHDIREALRRVFEEDGWAVTDFANSEAFLGAYRPGHDACLVVDAYLPGIGGLELLRRLRDAGNNLPAIMITGASDVTIAVQAMKAGASDFIEKPVSRAELLTSARRALEQSHDLSGLVAWRKTAAKTVANLTQREREVMRRVLLGHSNKNTAADLRLSQRTIENHRASVMKKTGSKSLPALARWALAAEWLGTEQPLAKLGLQSSRDDEGQAAV